MAYPTHTGFRAIFAQVASAPSQLPVYVQGLSDSDYGPVTALPLNPQQVIQEAK